MPQKGKWTDIYETWLSINKMSKSKITLNMHTIFIIILFGSPTFQSQKSSFDLSDSQTQSSSMSISFAPIQKCWPFLSVRNFTKDEIMAVLWLRQTVHIQGYFWLRHFVYAQPRFIYISPFSFLWHLICLRIRDMNRLLLIIESITLYCLTGL
jgi:hypothetical protein